MNAYRVGPKRIAALGAAMLVLAATTASAASPAAERPRTDPYPTRAAAMAIMISHRNLAADLTLRGHIPAALREWTHVARLQRSLGEMPIEALRARAGLLHALRRDGEAAAVMEELAVEALAGGNHELSARAYLEATTLFHRARRRERARECMEQVERLLAGPHIDATGRAFLEARIVRQ